MATEETIIQLSDSPKPLSPKSAKAAKRAAKKAAKEVAKKEDEVGRCAKGCDSILKYLWNTERLSKFIVLGLTTIIAAVGYDISSHQNDLALLRNCTNEVAKLATEMAQVAFNCSASRS